MTRLDGGYNLFPTEGPIRFAMCRFRRAAGRSSRSPLSMLAALGVPGRDTELDHVPAAEVDLVHVLPAA